MLLRRKRIIKKYFLKRKVFNMTTALNSNISSDKEKLRRLFKVSRVLNEMLKQRGYELSPVSMLVLKSTDLNSIQYMNISMDGFQDPFIPFDSLLQFRDTNNIFQNRIGFSRFHYSKDGRKVLVLFLDNKPGSKVDKDNFGIANHYIKESVRDIIIVTETGLNSPLLNMIRTGILGYNIEVFLDVELVFDKTKHSLAPIKTTHIPGKEVEKWGKEEGIKPEKLPMIQDTDTLSKWYGAKSYDVFQSEIVGTNTDTSGYYRIVRRTPRNK